MFKRDFFKSDCALFDPKKKILIIKIRMAGVGGGGYHDNTGSIHPQHHHSSVTGSYSINNSSGSATSSSQNTSIDTVGGSCRLCDLLCCRCCCSGRTRPSTNHQSDRNNCNSFFCGCYVNEENRPKWFTLLYKLTKTIIWKIIHVIFSIILLFGPAVQLLIVDFGQNGDLIFMILRILMLLFFVVDMTLRCITEDDYFVCTLCKIGDRAANASTYILRSSGNNSDRMDSTFRIGSFLFWCDLISTVSILYDLSFINDMRYCTIIKTWEVENGSLVSPIFHDMKAK